MPCPQVLLYQNAFDIRNGPEYTPVGASVDRKKLSFAEPICIDEDGIILKTFDERDRLEYILLKEGDYYTINVKYINQILKPWMAEQEEIKRKNNSLTNQLRISYETRNRRK